MFISILLLIVGFLFLVKGADMFVAGSCAIAKSLRIPTLIIGLTIVAFGTSAPEAAVSITAALQGQNDIALGNIIGSNIFNLLVVVGACAIFVPMKVDKPMLLRDFPFAILSCFLLFFFAWDGSINKAGQLGRMDGFLLLLLFTIFMGTLITITLRSRSETAEDAPVMHISLPRSLLSLSLGLAGVVLGGKLVVDSATDIALGLGVSEALVGLTIVAVGTSLPELVTSIVAARKGESDMALGNAVGSNIFNVYFILGLSATITPINVPTFSYMDIIIVGVVSIATYLFALTRRSINRWEGATMVTAYLAYTTYLILR